MVGFQERKDTNVAGKKVIAENFGMIFFTREEAEAKPPLSEGSPLGGYRLYRVDIPDRKDNPLFAWGKSTPQVYGIVAQHEGWSAKVAISKTRGKPRKLNSAALQAMETYAASGKTDDEFHKLFKALNNKGYALIDRSKWVQINESDNILTRKEKEEKNSAYTLSLIKLHDPTAIV